VLEATVLRGSLSDIRVTDLVAIPSSSGGTGELVIATIDDDARLYYVNGGLVHLELGDLRGRRVLQEIVRWDEGEFEFRTNVLTDQASFDGDLDAEISAAKEAASRAGGRLSDNSGSVTGSRTLGQLSEFIERCDARFALVSDAPGPPAEIVGEADDIDVHGLGAAVTSAITAAASIGAALGSGGFAEVLVEYDGCGVVCIPVGQGFVAVVTDGQAQLGVVRHKTKQLVELMIGRADGSRMASAVGPNRDRQP
jgi:predicted regulator of Ras-like GTPase activity (Roadblock/LC7/MglB family)